VRPPTTVKSLAVQKRRSSNDRKGRSALYIVRLDENDATATRSPGPAPPSFANRPYANFAPVAPHRWCSVRNGTYSDLDIFLTTVLRA